MSQVWGAEVVIDSSETHESHCHWCRNYLSLQNVVPNGAVPDLVLPFTQNRKMAQAAFEGYMKQHKHFAHQRFKKEFDANNIFTVYLPYATNWAFFTNLGGYKTGPKFIDGNKKPIPLDEGCQF